MTVRCAGNDDVIRAVDFARNNDLFVAVRSGGHSFAESIAALELVRYMLLHASLENLGLDRGFLGRGPSWRKSIIL
jgi:hypothetical protein